MPMKKNLEHFSRFGWPTNMSMPRNHSMKRLAT